MESNTLVDPIVESINGIENWDLKTFDFNPPKTQFLQKNHTIINVDGLIVKPDSNECKLLSLNPDKSKKKLDAKQLKDLRENGEFSVDSVQFAEQKQKHVWAVSRLLQTGTTKIGNSFLNGFANTCTQLVEYIPNRLYRGKITFVNGCKNFVIGCKDLPILLFGWIDKEKKYSEQDVSRKIKKIIANGVLDAIITARNIQNQQLAIETDNGMAVVMDLISYYRSISIIQKPYEKFKRDWEIKKPERLQKYYAEIKESGVGENKIWEKVGEMESEYTQTEIYNLIRSYLQSESAEELISLFQALRVVRKHITAYEQRMKQATEKYVTTLKTNHTVLSRIPEWLRRKEKEFVAKWVKENPTDATMEQISKDLEGQEKFIFDANIIIVNFKETIKYKDKLETQFEPSKIFSFGFRIRNHKNWVIKQNNGWCSVGEYNTLENETSYPGWRLANIGIRIGQVFNNGLFFFFTNAFYGKFGFRSIFGLKDFEANWTYDNSTGGYKPTITFKTWFGTIASLWNNIKESRLRFESEVDDGILGKSFTRIFNVLWNYVIKGAIGTPIVFFGYLILILLNTVIGIGAIVTSPIWSVILPLVKYLFYIIIYDTDAPNDN